MPLIVEDGTGSNPNANAYADVAGLTAWLETRGYDVPDDDVAEQRIHLAMDYLNTLEPMFQGYRVSAAQPLAWPRAGVWLNRYPLGTAVIPKSLILAQHQLAYEIGNGVQLLPTVTRTEPQLASRGVGPLRRSWFKTSENTSFNTSPILHAVNDLLRPLMAPQGIRAVRV